MFEFISSFFWDMPLFLKPFPVSPEFISMILFACFFKIRMSKTEFWYCITGFHKEWSMDSPNTQAYQEILTCKFYLNILSPKCGTALTHTFSFPRADLLTLDKWKDAFTYEVSQRVDALKIFYTFSKKGSQYIVCFCI